jgi:hypothetical protein
MMGVLQLPGWPGVPAGMWFDPYILGFTHGSIGAWAQVATGFKAKNADLGFALVDTHTAISNMNGQAVAKAANDFAIDKHPDFECGTQNATAYFLYCDGKLQDGDDKNHILRKATQSAKAVGKAGDKNTITALILTDIWNDEVRRVAERYRERRPTPSKV